ncbi:MAG: NAD(P)-binding domain-containing protein [Syntrophomonadaceae bacterium]|nr:NAD(P)-binding domain-containing protein [Syntrophomonadaceae bacterium]
MLTIGFFGFGRMGQALASRLSRHYEVLAYDQEENKTLEVQLYGASRTIDLSALCAAKVIILALPPAAIPEAVNDIGPFLKPGHILVNIATTFSTKELALLIKDKCHVAAAKIVGHAAEIMAGETPVVVVWADNEIVSKKVSEIFNGPGTVVFDREEVVRDINVLAAREAIYAVLRIREQMAMLGISENYLSPAIRGVAAGTMKAFLTGDIGPFAKQIVEDFLAEKRN